VIGDFDGVASGCITLLLQAKRAQGIIAG